VLNGVHAVGAKEGDLVASADGVDLGLGTICSARLATEVVLKDLLTLGGHVAASVLADVLPALANNLAIDLELVEGVVGAHSDGQRQHGSSSLHVERMMRGLVLKGWKRVENRIFDQRRWVRMNERVNE
jgi:hypothetical protein